MDGEHGASGAILGREAGDRPDQFFRGPSGTIRLTAMSRVGERGPVQRDEGAPSEIVERGEGIEPGRGDVLDAGRARRAA